MTKRLTKALREKRRWIGVLMHPSIRSRDQARQAVEALKQAHTSSDIKLMDFVSKADRKKTCEAAELSDTSPDGSLAISTFP